MVMIGPATMVDPNPGLALYNLIEAQALSLGYTLYDTVVVTTNTWKILKSAAAGNSQNKDWYLVIRYPTTGITNGINFSTFEAWDNSGHLGIRGAAPSGPNTQIETTFYSMYGTLGKPVGSTGWYISDTTSGIQLALLTTSFVYYVSLTRDRIEVLLGSEPASIAYAGFFVPYADHVTWAGSALYPLITVKFNVAGPSATAGNNIGLTRLPKLSAFISTGGWNNHVAILQGNSYKSFGNGQLAGFVSPFTGKITGFPLPVFVSHDGQNTYHFIGTVEDVIWVQAGGTVVRGDTITIGSDVWYSTSIASGGSLFMRGI